MPRSISWFVTATLLVTASLLYPTSSIATQVVPYSLPELGEDASLVVRGHVRDVRAVWNEDRTRILTEVSVAVDESFRGNAPSEVRVLQMGGVLDGVRMTVHGALDWSLDEEVVLFLAPSLPGRHRVSGFSQGKFEVVRAGGEVIVRRPALGGVEWVGAEARSLTARDLRLSLDQLLRETRVQEGGR